jgi:predicted HicB family RNase H-like nuclease
MANYLNHKGYIGTVEYSTEDEVFHGKIFGINDLVTFEGESVSEIKESFKEAVDDYIETCKELGKEPEKIFKGSFNVRVPSSIHKDAVLTATQYNISLNDFVKVALTYAINHKQEISREMHLVR